MLRSESACASGEELPFQFPIGNDRQTGIDVTFKAPGTTTSPTLVASLHEAFGADSIPRMRQRRFGARPPLTDVFQVDQDGRITGENLLLPGITLPPGEIDNGAVGSHMHEGAAWRAYDLDKIGNIKQRRMKASTLVHEVDKLSRLTRLGATPIKIDPTDNLQGPQGGPVQFTFDDFTGTVLTASNGAATSSFSYDALDRRRGEHRSADHSDHVYVWDGNQLVAHGSAGNLTLDVPGDDLDAHLVSIDQLGAGAQWFYHQGPDQSVLAVTGSAGLIEGYTYSAFGELSIWTPSGALANKSAFGNPFQFQGQLFDASTATYSMRARQYQPAWGNFISPDPLSTGGGPSLYAFAGSKPLHNRDPLGLEPDIVHYYGPRTAVPFSEGSYTDYTSHYDSAGGGDPSEASINLPTVLGGGGPSADATGGGRGSGDTQHLEKRRPLSLRHPADRVFAFNGPGLPGAPRECDEAGNCVSAS